MNIVNMLVSLYFHMNWIDEIKFLLIECKNCFIHIDINLVKELSSLCKLQNDKQEVRGVNHILKQGKSQYKRGKGREIWMKYL